MTTDNTIMGNQTDLARAESELRLAEREYETASLRESEARRASTSAKNLLNEKQKAFDALVEQIRNSAPRDSDWASRKIRGTGV